MTSPSVTLSTTADSKVVALIERLELGEPTTPRPGPAAPRLDPHRTPEQIRALPGVVDQVRGWRRDAGFRGAIVLASRDHNRITVYSRFDAGTERAGRPAPRVLSAVAAQGIQARTLDWRTYHLAWRAGNEASTVVSPDPASLVHFGLFTVPDGKADALLDKVEACAQASLATPGLRTINFHRSRDGERVVNFGTWSTFEHFQTLLSQPGFADNEKYWSGLATFQNDYFDVVDVVEDVVAVSEAPVGSGR
ncbi:MAG TPA: antibiotic biosynthesis monooxygenase [Pseudonocardiaceae bacterium]|jgi:quinol monooxygenase YgiN